MGYILHTQFIFPENSISTLQYRLYSTHRLYSHRTLSLPSRPCYIPASKDSLYGCSAAAHTSHHRIYIYSMYNILYYILYYHRIYFFRTAYLHHSPIKATPLLHTSGDIHLIELNTVHPKLSFNLRVSYVCELVTVIQCSVIRRNVKMPTLIQDGALRVVRVNSVKFVTRDGSAPAGQL